MATKLVIGITGGSGSGKTSLVHALRKALPVSIVDVITQDDYYHSIERQERDANGKVNFDLPSALDLTKFAQDLKSLRSGRSIEFKEYTFNNNTKATARKVVRPKQVILTEGLFLLCDKQVRSQIDHAIFVETGGSEQLDRRLRRDKKERGYTQEMVNYQWTNHVVPAYDKYIEPYRAECDLLISNDNRIEDSVEQLLDYVAIRIGLPVHDEQFL